MKWDSDEDPSSDDDFVPQKVKVNAFVFVCSYFGAHIYSVLWTYYCSVIINVLPPQLKIIMPVYCAFFS